MITEDYISFETALLLKEKGFEQVGCQKQYNTQGDLCVGYCYGPVAPTLQRAMKWLREVHDIYIKLEFDVDDDVQWHPSLAFIKGNKYIHTNELQWYDTYEQACEAAIKYCLENLV